jgi:pimeloyl-ACP methyl ester carboxylesterase
MVPIVPGAQARHGQSGALKWRLMLRCGPVTQRSFIRIGLFMVAVVAAVQQATLAAAPAAAPAFTHCELEHPLGLSAVEAQCTHVAVPENPLRPTGRQLQLFVARIPALSRQAAAEPLFILAGGPGLGASTFYSSAAPVFARIRRRHDIVIVDQRGTGRSHPLLCQFDEQQMWDAGEEQTARVMRECRATLEKSHDLAQYTTSIAVRDLEAVRLALGYGRISFYGSSYGTRVAQHYARRYPASTEALILDGVVPPTRILGTSTPLDAERSLQQVFERCRRDAACQKRFGDPAQDYRELRERLARSPVDISMTDPHSGAPRKLAFSGSALAGALRLATYSAEQAALLPLALHLANRRNQFGPLASQFLLSASGYDAVLAYGMHNSVVCAEDVPFFAASDTSSELSATFLGSAQIDALKALCSDWPRGPIDPDFHQKMNSPVPALLLSGTADPVTPAAFGDEAALGFEYALHLKMPDQGHGQLAQPCMDGIMAAFLDAAHRSRRPRVDTNCLTKVVADPFFLDMGGPGP